VHLLYCPGADVTADSFLSYYRDDGDFDTLALAAAGTAAVLVIVGTEDPISAGVVEAVTAGDADDRISLLMVEGADHFFRDLYTYDVVEGIVAWLDSVQAE
jgi:alpha/beta superfamily hydrolase